MVELARRIAESRPGIRIVLMSGYPNDILDPYRTVEPGLTFLRKPIAPGALAQRVRDVLGSPAIARLTTDLGGSIAQAALEVRESRSLAQGVHSVGGMSAQVGGKPGHGSREVHPGPRTQKP
jgi:hypothetical protein